MMQLAEVHHRIAILFVDYGDLNFGLVHGSILQIGVDILLLFDMASVWSTAQGEYKWISFHRIIC